MRLLTDENVAVSVIRDLREAGHDVFDIKEAGWHGKPDTALIHYAIRTRRVIITHDKDFLHQKQAAVIILRFYDQQPRLVAMSLVHFLDSRFAKKIKRGIRVILAEQRIEIHRGTYV